MRNSYGDYCLIPKGGDELNSPVLLPLRERPGHVQTFSGALDLVEVHLDWLDGDAAKVEAYIARERVDYEAHIAAERSAAEAHQRYWDSIPVPVMDDIDRNILAARVARRDRVQGPRPGDFVMIPGDPEPIRLIIAGLNGISTTRPNNSPRCYLTPEGRLDPSGGRRSLDHIAKSQLIDTGETKPGACWFFHHDVLAPKGGIHVEIDCRVYRIREQGPPEEPQEPGPG